MVLLKLSRINLFHLAGINVDQFSYLRFIFFSPLLINIYLFYNPIHLPMKHLNISLLAVLFVLTFISCKKNNEPAPVASYTAPDSGYLEQELLFSSTSQNANTIKWDFGDGTTSSLNSTSHSYTTGKSFRTSITASNGSGSNTAYKYITIVDGHAEYDAVNKTETAVNFFGFYGIPGENIEELQDLGAVSPSGSSHYFPTNHSYLYLGGKVGSINFYCIKTFPINIYTKNHLTLCDTTLVYFGGTSAPPFTGLKQQMLKDLLQEHDQ
jgi:hypothetical protein